MARRNKPQYGTYPREKIHLLDQRIQRAWRGHWREQDAHLNAQRPIATLRLQRREDLELVLHAQPDLDYLMRLARAMARELKRPSGELQFMFKEWDEVLVLPKKPPR